MNFQNKTKDELIFELQELQQKHHALLHLWETDAIERKQLAAELMIAHKEADVEHNEKAKRAAELILVNLELNFQNEEKTKRAADLIIANIELVFQKEEKVKRAKELNAVQGRMEVYESIYEKLIQTNNELQQAIEKVDESEETYRMLYDSMNDALFTSELQQDGTLGKFILVNDVACQRLGYTREELLTKTPSDINTDHSRELMSSRIQKILGEKHVVVESEHITKDGKVIPVELSTNITKFRNKIIFNTVARDITERRQSEYELQEKTDEAEAQSEEYLQINEEYLQINDELQQTNRELILAKQKAEDSEEKFRVMVKNSNDTFVLINEKGEQFYISDAAERDTGYTVEELRGPIENVIYPDDLETVNNAWNEVLSKEGEVVRVQYRHKHKYKEYVWYEAVCQNFINNPVIKAVVVNVRDITVIKETELELTKAKEHAEESDRLKTAFLQNMSHEIRTPMNAIMGFSDLLVSNFDNKPKLEKFADIIGQRCNDLLEIINDILDISKIESGQLPINVEEFNLNELFKELSTFFKEYQKRLGKNQITFKFHGLDRASENLIITDKIKLKQIFINLVSNAFKFTDTGIIEGGCRFDKTNNLVFYVKDTGIGIPLDKQKLVFERFTQLHESSRKNIGGTGLGLSIVKGLIDLLGGQIFLESEPNKGSTFSFTFPYKTTKPVLTDSIIPENINDKGLLNKTILIVEDDFYNLEYLKEILADTGLTLLQAENGREAIDMSKSNSIDLILMDIRLPDMNGYEVTSQIRQHKPHLKIIAQTAYASHDENQKALNAGCDDYISKPTKRGMLLSMISAHLSENAKN